MLYKKIVTILLALCTASWFGTNCTPDSPDNTPIILSALLIQATSPGGSLAAASGCSAGEAKARYTNNFTVTEVFRLYTDSSCSTAFNSYTDQVTNGSTSSYACTTAGTYYLGTSPTNIGTVTCTSGALTFTSGIIYIVEHTSSDTITTTAE